MNKKIDNQIKLNNINLFACLFIVILMLNSCYSNVICFDQDTQSIEREHGLLLNVTIENRNISLYAKQKNGCKSTKFYLKNMLSSNPDYIFDESFIDNLSPNTEYEISTRSNGDAGIFRIYIKTDSYGNVYEMD